LLRSRRSLLKCIDVLQGNSSAVVDDITLCASEQADFAPSEQLVVHCGSYRPTVTPV